MNKYVKYGLVALGLGAGTYVTVKVLKNRKGRQTRSETEQINRGISTVENLNYPLIARTIADALGTGGTVLNPWNWTEDEQTALEEVLKVPKSGIPTLSTAYNKITSRVLVSDLQRYLSSSDYQKIAYKFG